MTSSPSYTVGVIYWSASAIRYSDGVIGSSSTSSNTTPSSTNINIVVNGNEPMSFDEYNTLLTAGTLITVMNNGTDVTKQANIDQENCTATSCTIKIRYNGIEKTKTIAIK